MTGIWRVALDGKTPPSLFAATDDQNLVGDVEGLDIYHGESSSVLLASSQGDSSYVAYDLVSAEQLAKFAVASTPDDSIDGTQDTDGIAVSNAATSAHPRGLLVVQDGFNVDQDQRALNQNFKILDWRDVEKLFSRAATPNQE
jgi:3-phytase